jgi:hypothetical protein
VALGNLPPGTGEQEVQQLVQGLPVRAVVLDQAAAAKKAGGSEAARRRSAAAEAEKGRLAWLLCSNMEEAYEAARKLHLSTLGGRRLQAMAIK